MKSLFVLLVLTACAIAHNGDRTPRNPHARRARNGYRSPIREELEKLINEDPLPELLTMNFRVPKYIMSVKDRDRIPHAPIETELPMLNEEIKKIKHLSEKSEILNKPEWEVLLQRTMMHPNVDHKDPAKPSPSNIINIKDGGVRKPSMIFGKVLKFSNQGQPRSNDKEDKQKEKKTFAWTPMDREYFSTFQTSYTYTVNTSTTKFNRDLRQNPNLSRDKTLITGKLDELKKTLNSDNSGSSTAEPQGVFGINSETVYLVGLSAAFAAAVIVPTVILAYGIYIMVKRANAGTSVEYPSYGVTGPSVDSYGDCCLAQSAQMYHYHHQKQQIIAMERNANEQRYGSLSDPESDENEEGDYTVYECPGFATTGEMEVKNPLFDEATPATPGKVQVVLTQLKE